MDDYPGPNNESFDIGLVAQPYVQWQFSSPVGQPQNQPSNFAPTSYPTATNDSDDGPPGLVDSPIDLYYPDEFVTIGVYERYSSGPKRSYIYGLFFSLLRINATSGPLVDALGDVMQNDLQGISALEHWDRQGRLPEHGEAALRALANSGYDKAECRALVYLCLMNGSLSWGDFSLWATCLEFLLGWAEGVYLDPESSGFHNSIIARFILPRVIWSDLIAGATKGLTSLHTHTYRWIFPSAETDILSNCSNNVALALAEIIALAANPGLIRRAGRNLDQLRVQVAHSSDPILDSLTIKKAIHTAGVQLLLEITANSGNIEATGLQGAVENMCEMISWVEDSHQRDFAFWIFLAGCHTLIPDVLNNCRNMMGEIFIQSGDWAVRAAINVMEEVYHAREQRTAQPDIWRVKMNKRGLILL